MTTDLGATGGASFAGTVNFVGNRAVTSGAGVSFTGDVNAGGTLAFTVGTGQSLDFHEGTWTQGANALTVNGAAAAFNIGDSSNNPARLVMTGGTITIANSGPLTVAGTGRSRSAPTAAAAETVTVANGSGGLAINGTLAVGFGAVNDELVKTGNGLVQIGPAARLVGSGLAGSTATAVLASQTALITGRFADSADPDDNPLDFFAGGDIVTPAYSFVDLTVKAGGVAAPTGTAAGTLPDGDRFAVKSSLGAAAGLVTVEDRFGNLGVVVRNATAAGASTLTFTALGGGDGQLSVGGVAVHTPGAVTVTAPAANFTRDFTTTGTLTALTARDLGTSSSPSR